MPVNARNRTLPRCMRLWLSSGFLWPFRSDLSCACIEQVDGIAPDFGRTNTSFSHLQGLGDGSQWTPHKDTHLRRPHDRNLMGETTRFTTNMNSLTRKPVLVTVSLIGSADTFLHDSVSLACAVAESRTMKSMLLTKSGDSPHPQSFQRLTLHGL